MTQHFPLFSLTICKGWLSHVATVTTVLSPLHAMQSIGRHPGFIHRAGLSPSILGCKPLSIVFFACITPRPWKSSRLRGPARATSRADVQTENCRVFAMNRVCFARPLFHPISIDRSPMRFTFTMDTICCILLTVHQAEGSQKECRSFTGYVALNPKACFTNTGTNTHKYR